MDITLANFQIKAISDLMGAMLKPNKEIVLKSCTGSGKTTLTHHIKKKFGDDVSVIYHDNYYKDQTGVPFEVRCRQNYDHPDAFETDLMVRHLKALKAGKAVITVKTYNGKKAT